MKIFSKYAITKLALQEKNGAFGEIKTVRRDSNLMDNSLLPLAFTRRAGDLMYQRLLEGFEGENFNVPRPCPPLSSLECVSQLTSSREKLYLCVNTLNKLLICMLKLTV
jgi:hypothetical protein